jgi:hypothetical protein
MGSSTEPRLSHKKEMTSVGPLARSTTTYLPTTRQPLRVAISLAESSVLSNHSIINHKLVHVSTTIINYR